jgi:hypothetical protein
MNIVGKKKAMKKEREEKAHMKGGEQKKEN